MSWQQNQLRMIKFYGGLKKFAETVINNNMTGSGCKFF
jgi:hypothetical protein